MIADMASPSRGAFSSLASRSKRSSISWRSCGVMAFSIASIESARPRCRARFVAQGVGPRIKFMYATIRPAVLHEPCQAGVTLFECNFIQGQQRREIVAGEIGMLDLALRRQRIE